MLARSAHGLSLGYLDQAVFIHYAPGHRFAYWALGRLAPLDWPLALGTLLVLFAGSVWLLHRICVQLFGDRRSYLVVPLVFATSVVLVPSFLWFADGVHKLPSTFLTLLAIHAYLRHREDRSRATLALSVAAMSLGLLFYAKVLLVPLYLVLLRLLFLERRPSNWLRALWEERWTWLAFAAPAGVYLWNYELNYSSLAGHKLLFLHRAGAFYFPVPCLAFRRDPGLSDRLLVGNSRLLDRFARRNLGLFGFGIRNTAIIIGKALEKKCPKDSCSLSCIIVLTFCKSSRTCLP